MIVPRCPHCGAELLAEARFCRQCGGVTEIVPGASASSELPTALLCENVNTSTTQRLDPRPTTPEREAFVPPVSAAEIGAGAVRRLPATLILGIVVIVIIVGIISAVTYVRMRSQGGTTDNAALVYPGSQVIVDMSGDGGRALHLQTGDSLERVVAWYETNLKPTKTMRLTSTSIVLKNKNVTATIAAEGAQTNILIKQMQE